MYLSRRNAVRIILAGAAALFAASAPSIAAERAPLGIKGYDPVAYFTEKRATLGDPQYQHEWDGTLYHFASAKHLEMFKADPDRYLPQYNPEYWTVVDGRLYLFGGAAGPSLMAADPAMTRRADGNWPKVSQLPEPSRQ